MPHLRTLVPLGLMTAVAIATSASTASAITATPAGAIALTSLGALTFGGGGFTISCPFTLRGTLGSSIEGVAGAHLGEVTSGAAGACNTGSATLLFGNAWNLVYESAELASTPKKMAWKLAGFQVLLSSAGLTCLYESSVPLTIEGEGTPMVTRLVIIRAPNVLSLHEAALNSVLCIRSLEVRGTFAFTTQTLTLP